MSRRQRFAWIVSPEVHVLVPLAPPSSPAFSISSFLSPIPHSPPRPLRLLGLLLRRVAGGGATISYSSSRKILECPLSQHHHNPRRSPPPKLLFPSLSFCCLHSLWPRPAGGTYHRSPTESGSSSRRMRMGRTRSQGSAYPWSVADARRSSQGRWHCTALDSLHCTALHAEDGRRSSIESYTPQHNGQYRYTGMVFMPLSLLPTEGRLLLVGLCDCVIPYNIQGCGMTMRRSGATE